MPRKGLNTFIPFVNLIQIVLITLKLEPILSDITINLSWHYPRDRFDHPRKGKLKRSRKLRQETNQMNRIHKRPKPLLQLWLSCWVKVPRIETMKFKTKIIVYMRVATRTPLGQMTKMAKMAKEIHTVMSPYKSERNGNKCKCESLPHSYSVNS